MQTKSKKPTIYDIKRLTAETSPYYFSRNTMRGFGQTLRDFKVYAMEDGKFLISAPIRYGGKVHGNSERIFDPKTNTLTPVPR